MPTAPFDIVIVAQDGRLSYEAVLFAASLRHSAPGFDGTLYVAEPQPGPLWPRDPRVSDPEASAALERLGVVRLPFESRHFGAAYPNGNKVEALAALPPDRPFLFFDTDTIVTGPLDDLSLDFGRPSASMRRENTWPVIELYGPGYADTWRAVHDRFGIAFEPTLDLSQPDEHWERYLYFNAGWFYGRSGPDFARSMIDVMTSLRDAPPPELVCQPLYPWLDQIALPVVIAGCGGGRPGPDAARLDGELAWHWRALPLLYAQAPDETLATFHEIVRPNRIKKILKRYEPFRRMIYQRRGERVRALFDQAALPRAERVIRQRIKRERMWMR